MVGLSLDQAFQIAVRHHQAGQLAQAESLYRQILAQRPDDANALHLLGVVAHQVGRNDIAVDLIGRAIALRPENPEAHYNLGNALKAGLQMDQAIAAFRAAVRLKPDYLDAHYNLGNALKDTARTEEAIAAYRQAVALKFNFPKVHNNLGNALKDKGLLDEALASYRQAISLKPDYSSAHNNLGIALSDKGLFDEAIAAFGNAIALNPNFDEAYYNLGFARRANGQLDEAIAAYRQAIALNPNSLGALSNLGTVFKDTGRLDEAIEAYRRAIAIEPGAPEPHSNLIYAMQFHPAYDAKATADEERNWERRHAQPLEKLIQPHLNDRTPQRQLRIGYVSPDLREHPVAPMVLGLLENHDRQQLQIFCYAQVKTPDSMTARIRASADQWSNTFGTSDEEMSDLIRQDQIDILVDLALHSAGNRLLVFARKPAPVQVTFCGYPGSTGLHSIDYRLSDPHLDPPGSDESIYSEQTIRLPDTYWYYRPVITSLEPGPSPAAERGYITFGCLNNFCKVNDWTLSVWGQILNSLPNSRLLLHAEPGSHRQRVQERMFREGIESDRIRFANRAPSEDYFRLYRDIDIALDPFPYSGGITTCDALWMGVPAVTLSGKTAVGRGGVSLLTNIGLAELVAQSPQEYVRIAVELANDLARLKDLRSRLRDRTEQSPLMNAPRFARNIDAAYRQMWRSWCAR